MGTVERVFVAGAGGQPMRPVDAVQAVAGRGLDGDRYATRARPPCRYIESITEPGMTRALAARRGGICVRVVESGLVRTGDEIELLLAAEGAETPRPGPVLRVPNR